MAHLNLSQSFVLFAVETCGVLREAAEEFVGKLGQYLCKTTEENCSREYLLLCASIAVQKGNAAAVLDTMGRLQLGVTFACLDACMICHLYSSSCKVVDHVHCIPHTHENEINKAWLSIFSCRGCLIANR